MTLTTGEKLKAMRTERKLTQQQIADQIEATKSLVSMYESGRRMPGRKTLCKLANLFGVTVDYLLGLDIDNSSALAVKEGMDNSFINISVVPLYDSVNAYIGERPSSYANKSNLLIDYSDENLFYIKCDDISQTGWILAEKCSGIVDDATYLVRDKEEIVRMLKGRDIPQSKREGILGLVKSITYLY